jgi:hypothetical protein
MSAPKTSAMENESRNLTIGTLIGVAHAWAAESKNLKIENGNSKLGPSPLPRFFVSVASKEFSFPVSPLDATLVGAHVSVASKGVVYSKIVERAVCFVNVASRGLRPKSRLQKAETPASGWRSPVRARYYPRNTVRWDSLFVNRKLEKARVRPRRNGGGKGKTRIVSSQPSRK